MAIRPIFIPITQNETQQLVKEIGIEFKWHPGMAPSQKKKNVEELHLAAKNLKYHQLLEVSTKSENKIGVMLSAFNLKLTTSYFSQLVSLEAAFQGSKVFEYGGPYHDLYSMDGSQIKKDRRLKESGKIKGFEFNGLKWGVNPKTAFYDWLYLNALSARKKLLPELLSFNGFSDIEFNPKKSINCQARSCALAVGLIKRGLFEDALANRDYFIRLIESDSIHQHKYRKNSDSDLFL